jgi:hypothetical protein
VIRFARQLFLTLILPAIAAAQTQPVGDRVVADFEKGHRSTVIAKNVAATKTSEPTTPPNEFLRLEPQTPDAGTAYVRLVLPAQTSMAGSDRLTARLRASTTQPTIHVTWLGLDAKAEPIFQRRFSLKPGEQWMSIDEPLRAWRWSEQRIGDWDEVKELALRIDSPDVKQLDLDDVRLEGKAAPDARAKWLLDLAFSADRPPLRTAECEGLMVATDAADAFADEDLGRLIGDMKQARSSIRRVFGDAVRPTDDVGSPAMLIIFANDNERSGFFDRLGEAWDAKIARHNAQGYTVHDIATAIYVKELGVRRPVYLHEAVHAIVARELRLQVGYAPHTALQEGIANYFQLCAHPKSIDRNAYVKVFAPGVDVSGKGLFKPIESLFTAPVTTREYAQLASLVAYLVERDQPLLRALAKGLAAGERATNILKQHGTDWQALEDAWLAWGRRRFKTAPPEGQPPFDCPAELR